MASRYFMMFFLILEESTQVTKSSMFLHSESQHNSRTPQASLRLILPGNQKGRISDNLRSNPNMALLDELVGSADMLRHPQPRHDNSQSTPAESRNSDFPLDVAELALSATTDAEQAHVVEFLEQLVLLLAAELGLWGQQSDAMSEMTELTSQAVVRAVVVRVGERVPTDNFCAAMAGV
jgi:hypothetical protein